MTSTAPQADESTVWDRRERAIYRLVPYAALALSAVFTAFFMPPTGATLAVTLAVGAAVTLWILWFVTLHPGWVNRRGLMVFYFVGLLAAMAWLVVHAPLFGFFAFTGYLHAYMALRGNWRLVGVAATGVLAGTSQNGGLPDDAGASFGVWIGLVLLNVGLSTAFSRVGWAQEERSANRKAMIEELAKANRKLAATVQENIGLHAQLLAQAREAGILDERQRMAREIHDTIAQGLAGVITQLEAAGQARDRRTEWQRHIDNAMNLARESLAEARRSVRAVRPERLDNAQLPDALTDLVARWSAINGVSAELTCTGTASQMHPEIEVALLRTAQEALANVGKHANAQRVGLTLSYMSDLVTLDVRDDGVGFEPARVPVGSTVTATISADPARVGADSAAVGAVPATVSADPATVSAANGSAGPAAAGGTAGSGSPPARDGGFGLTAMRQRIDRVGGRLEIESEPGAGTAISASVPAIYASES